MSKRKRKQTPINLEKQTLALEAFSSDSFLSINKKLLHYYGPSVTIFLCNLIDKFKYFKSQSMLEEDSSFFLRHEDQTIQTGMNEYELRKCKKKLIDDGVISTQMRGIPPKEFYLLNIDILVDKYLRNIPLNFKGITVENSKDLTSKNSRNIKNNKYKNNKDKDNKLIPTNKFVGNESEENNPNNSLDGNKKPSIKERNKQYLPLANMLARIIQTNKNIKHTTSQLNTWANEIRQLEENNGISYHRIKDALRWYKKNIGGEFIPVIESGNSLRNKFMKLEWAMKNKNKKNGGTKLQTGYMPKEGYKHRKADKTV